MEFFPLTIISIIKESYEHARCFVRHKGKLSVLFEVWQGVRQGCILSPILFFVVIDDVLFSTIDLAKKYGIQWRPFDRLSHLDYADDICFVTSINSGLAKSMQENAEPADLKNNSNKTKTMHTGRDTQNIIVLRQTPIEEVEQFNYLGSMVSLCGGVDLDIANRISKARCAFGMLICLEIDKRYHAAPNRDCSNPTLNQCFCMPA